MSECIQFKPEIQEALDSKAEKEMLLADYEREKVLAGLKRDIENEVSNGVTGARDRDSTTLLVCTSAIVAAIDRFTEAFYNTQ